MIGMGMRLMGVVSLLACGTANASTHTEVTSGHSQVQGSWEKLGAREVDGKADHDQIAVGRDDGQFQSMQIQVDGSSVEIWDIKVTFGNGEVFEPKVKAVFDKNSRSRVIDFPGNKRNIKKVEFRYGNLPGGGKAKIELWAK